MRQVFRAYIYIYIYCNKLSTERFHCEINTGCVHFCEESYHKREAAGYHGVDSTEQCLCIIGNPVMMVSLSDVHTGISYTGRRHN